MSTDNTDSSISTGNTALLRTEIEYAKQIKKHYQSVKDFLHDGALANPSNGNLRDVCKQLLLNGMTKEDERVVRKFFAIGQDENLLNVLDTEITSFRRVVKFLKGASQETDIKNLNLIAILIDFRARPYPEFRKSGVFELVKKNVEGEGNQGISTVKIQEGDEESAKAINWMRIAILTCVAGLSAVMISKIVSGNSPYMQWQTDHYVAIDENSDDASDAPIYKMDAQQFNIRLKKVSDTTTFFKKGAPLYWYIQDNGYRFFDHPGPYPLDRTRQLKKVSIRIAKGVHDGEIKTD